MTRRLPTLGQEQNSADTMPPPIDPMAAAIIERASEYLARTGITDAVFVINPSYHDNVTSVLQFLHRRTLSAVPEQNLPLPQSRWSTAVFLSPRSTISWMMAYRIWQSGIRRVVFPTLAGWSTTHPARIMLGRMIARGHDQILRGIVDMPNRWLAAALLKNWPISPVCSLQARLTFPRLPAAVAGLLRTRKPIADPKGPAVIVSSNLSSGGAEGRALTTLIGLRHSGLNVGMLCSSSTPGIKVYDAGNSPVSILQPASGGVDTENLMAAARELRPILKLLPAQMADETLQYGAWYLRHRPPLVHSWQDYLNITAGLAAAAVGVPRVILGLANMAPLLFHYFRQEMHPIYRALAQHPSVRLVNNSAAGARSYERWLGLPEGSIFVVRNGVNPARIPDVPAAAAASYRAEFGIPQDAPVVGSLYRFDDVKNPQLWLETARRVLASIPDCHFLLVGDGQLRPALARQADTLGLSGRLHMPGVTPSPAVALAAMDCFLLTSRYEGLPNALIEAQAMGIPVVSTAVGGVEEAMAHGITGWASPDQSPEALSALVVRVLSDRDWRQTSAASGPLLVRRRFGFDRMIDETAALYALPDRSEL